MSQMSRSEWILQCVSALVRMHAQFRDANGQANRLPEPIALRLWAEHSNLAPADAAALWRPPKIRSKA